MPAQCCHAWDEMEGLMERDERFMQGRESPDLAEMEVLTPSCGALKN